MNCCDDNGKCTGGAGCAARTVRSCDELGVCQHKRPRCEGCTVGLQLTSEGIRFAPGEIEHYRTPFLGTPAQRRELARWSKQAAALLVVVGLASLAVGVIAGRLQ
ncbi:hypothetical protein ACVC7V_17390 [Hydrogenophaga sp. A37]|uniref:hypothetical protein n=1 Tax=Hydrogenophaga sp. A37 TaxID=1945864 RepID=UPI000984BC46|nr:hypothetical protein [Hydrogenophaga sp. A37]OOG79190.1 hypothetical protein B0E41_25550 [Hydrogenophaga sp. A37]